jgi:hypothetical protein
MDRDIGKEVEQLVQDVRRFKESGKSRDKTWANPKSQKESGVWDPLGRYSWHGEHRFFVSNDQLVKTHRGRMPIRRLFGPVAIFVESSYLELKFIGIFIF